MTSKERAQLRGQANSLEPLFQIGKGGMSDALIAQTADALRKRELIKLKVLLESAPETPREFADKLAEATESEVVQVIGGVIVLYKENTEPEEKKKKPAKKGKPLSKVKAKRAAAAKREAAQKQEKKDFYAKRRAYQSKGGSQSRGGSSYSQPKRRGNDR